MRGTKRKFEDVSGDDTKITMVAKAFERYVDCDTMDIYYKNKHCYPHQSVWVPCRQQPQTGLVYDESFLLALQKYTDDACTGKKHPNPQYQDCVFVYLHTACNKEPVIIECLNKSEGKSPQWVCYDHLSGCCIKVADLSKHPEVFLKSLEEAFNTESFTVTNANQVEGITTIGLYTCYGQSAEVKDAQGIPIRPANNDKVRVSAQRNDPLNDQMEKMPNHPVSTSRGPMIKVTFTFTPKMAEPCEHMAEPCEYEGYVYLRHLGDTHVL